jgi:hypothetical protein
VKITIERKKENKTALEEFHKFVIFSGYDYEEQIEADERGDACILVIRNVCRFSVEKPGVKNPW